MGTWIRLDFKGIYLRSVLLLTHPHGTAALRRQRADNTPCAMQCSTVQYGGDRKDFGLIAYRLSVPTFGGNLDDLNTLIRQCFSGGNSFSTLCTRAEEYSTVLVPESVRDGLT